MESIVLDGLLAKTEGTYGTDSVPVVGTDGVRLAEHFYSELSYEYAFPNDRDDVASGSLIPAVGGIPVGKIIDLRIAIELKGAGAAYDDGTVWPEARPLLLATPLSEAVVTTPGSETVTYTHAETGHGSCTLYAYGGGQLFKIVGCRGSIEWPVEAGTLNRVIFQMQGMVTAITDVSLPAITYSSVASPTSVAMGLALNPGSSWSPDFISSAFQQGAEIKRLDDANAADGVEGFFVSKVDPRFTLTARKAALSAYDPFALADTRANHTIDYNTSTADQYEQVALDVNLAYLDAPPRAVEDNEFAGWELMYRLQHFAIVFS